MRAKGLLTKANNRQSKLERHLTITVLLLLSSCCVINAQTTELNEDISVQVEASAYSLKFIVDDPESYEIVNVTCKSSRNTIFNEENICENLDPCTAYSATLTIRVLNEDNEEQKFLDATTEYVEPTVEILEVTSYVDQIHLAWQATDRTCISAYKLEVLAENKESTYDLSKERSDWLITGLKPCQLHNITLKTIDVNSKLVSTLLAQNTTEYSEPGNVNGISIDTTVESGHAMVTWDQPENYTCINFYILKWFTKECATTAQARQTSTETAETESPDDNTCSWSVNLTSYEVKNHYMSGLQGCETYGLQFYINNDIDPHSEVETFTALEAVPSAVKLQAAEIDASSVTLHWNLPESNAKCVKDYLVTVTGPSEKAQVIFDTSTKDTYAFFDDLEPCGTYEYTVQPMSLNGTAGDEVKAGFKTLEAKPSAIRDLELHPSSRSIEVSWTQPDYANLCIDYYRITTWESGKDHASRPDIHTTKTNENITELISCQSYTIQVIPVPFNTQDGNAKSMDIETSAEKPDQPSNIDVISLYSDGIELNVRYDSKSNCETIFARIACYPNKEEEKLTKKSAEKTVEGKRSGLSFTALVSPLSPFTEYNCDVKLYNIAGYGSSKIITKIETKQYYSDVPESIAVKSSTENSLTFQWLQPSHPNGNINVYISHLQRVRAEYFVPPHCPLVSTQPSTSESSSREQNFSPLQPYTRYSIQIAAKNDYGVGEYTRPFMAITKPIASEPVKELKVTPQGPFESDKKYQANVLVSWTIPCRSNGKIKSFVLSFNGARKGEPDHNFTRFVDITDQFGFDDDGKVVYNETNLEPDYTYQVGVVVRVEDVDVGSAPESRSFDSPAGIPKRFNETTASEARVTVIEADNPTNSAVVRFPAYILESESGEIIYAALLVSQKGCNDEPPLQFGALVAKDNWPDIRKWSDVYADEENMYCIPQYQTTKLRWEPKTNAVGDIIQFTIGTEACSKTDDNYCNGALRPDTEYYLVIRLFTKSGYNDAVLLDFRTESLIQLELILISISCCLLFALLAGFVYIYMKKRMQWKRQSCHDIEDPFGDILAKNFATYYNEISRPERVSREFKELTMVAMDFSYSASELGCNKNRYTDIYPYDKNRVILDIDAEGSDYINASFIDGYRLKKQYIATQGPKPESTLDFWRMVLQHNIRVIVMLTQFMEGDIVKCHEYFPYKSKGINVTVKKKETFELYDRSEMSVTHDRYGLKQKVVHFYFKKWPDHGVPVDPAHLITFVRKVKAEKVPSYSSIVVHCSAGVGRTGTFIGLDIIMQRIKNESKINIYGTVKKLRFQRMKMVQTLEQYSFLYKCAYELVKHKDQRNKMKQNGKKVSFQDDTEANAISAISTLSGGPSSKANGRLIPTQLSAIQELEHENATEVPTTNGGVNRERPYLRLNNGSSPSLVNGFTKKTENDINESAM